MSIEDATPRPVETAPPARREWRRRMWQFIQYALVVVAIYLLVAYIVLPALWTHYEHQPDMAAAPTTTFTSLHIPGDPVNVSLVGTKEEVIGAFLDAGWYPADPITLKTSLKIAERVIRDRPYPTAPVSNLYLFNRKEDLAFERPAANSPKQREHVRFWLWEHHEVDGRPQWLGAATFDHSVGVSHYTGQITHHIAPDVDAERDRMMADLAKDGLLTRTYQVTGLGPTLYGRNGGGDRYYTDGEIDVGILAAENIRQKTPPERLANPAAVKLKNRIWSWIRPWL